MPDLPAALRANEARLIAALRKLPPDHQEGALRALVSDVMAGVKARAKGAKAVQLAALQETAAPLLQYTHQPADARTFLLDEAFLNRGNEAYPEVVKEFCEINSGKYNEVVLTGSIGSAKTTVAIWTTAYQLYRLSCLRHPQRSFGLQGSDEILFVLQSLNERLAKSLNFDRLRHLLLDCAYFTEQFKFDTGIESELRFPNRLIVKPVSGNDTAAIGQNVFGGILDEVNFMSVTEESKRTVDGGTYNQALSLYNTISRRRKSRFMQDGKVPGIFCIVSSKCYPGQFTDVKAEEAKTDKTIYVYDKRSWDVLPPERFSGKWFNVFTGDLTRKPRIMEPGETLPATDKHLVVPVPEDYRTEFQSDMMNALRDIAGVSTLARHPFIMNNEAVAACFGTAPSVLTTTQCDFVTSKLGIIPKRIQDKEHFRFVHIDLGVTGDAAGVACGYVPRFTNVRVADDLVETMPILRYDFTLRITPPRGDEIMFHKIRDLLYKLREAGLPIKWVTLDSFQSRDTMQVLRSRGFVTGLVSVDTETTPYDTLKTAFYQGRVQTPDHEHAERELISLERIIKPGGKMFVDHPADGSKDVADAMAGVAYGLTMRREIWMAHDITPAEIPQSVLAGAQKTEHKLVEGGEDGQRVFVAHRR